VHYSMVIVAVKPFRSSLLRSSHMTRTASDFHAMLGLRHCVIVGMIAALPWVGRSTSFLYSSSKQHCAEIEKPRETSAA
jgi:hypothetical protein